MITNKVLFIQKEKTMLFSSKIRRELAFFVASATEQKYTTIQILYK